MKSLLTPAPQTFLLRHHTFTITFKQLRCFDVAVTAKPRKNKTLFLRSLVRASSQRDARPWVLIKALELRRPNCEVYLFVTMGCPTPQKIRGSPRFLRSSIPTRRFQRPRGNSMSVNPAAGHPAPGPAKTVFSRVRRRSPRACRLC